MTKSNSEYQIYDGLGKLPPQAVEIEEAVLGALVLENSALNRVIKIIDVGSFYRDDHKAIFKAIKTLFDQGLPVDILTVLEQLKKDKALNETLTPYFLTTLTNKVNSSGNIEYHSRIVAEKALKRDLIKMASNIQEEGYQDDIDVFQIMDRYQNQIEDLRARYVKKDFKPGSELFSETVEYMENKTSDTEGLTGIPSGFYGIDKITSGWQNSDLIILAARPGQGKTAWAVSTINSMIADFGKKVALFSLEMSDIQIAMRMISARTKIIYENIKKGKLSEDEWGIIIHKMDTLLNDNFQIDDSGIVSVNDFKARARNLKQDYDIDIILIDYLQLMTAEGKGNREQEINKVSSNLKAVAKELDIPIIALSQLSRQVEQRADKRPVLADLRESGAIEQNADIVAFLYRPEYYGIYQDSLGQSTKGKGEFIIQKHRNGDVGIIPLEFQPSITLFSDQIGDFQNDPPF